MTAKHRVAFLCAAVLAGLPVVAVYDAGPASASVAQTDHTIPYLQAGQPDSAGDTGQCLAANYSCTDDGYNGTSSQLSSTAGSGALAFYNSGSPSTASARHNCTMYVAFRLAKNGYKRNWSGDGSVWSASNWANEAARLGIKVDQTPAVGAVAQWNKGHVGYVSALTSSYMVVRSDNYGHNTTNSVKILRSSPYRPDNFIHFKDVGGATSGHWESVSGHLVQLDLGPQGSLWGVNSSGTIYQYAGRGHWTARGNGFKHVTVGAVSDNGPYVYAIRNDNTIVRWRT